MYSTGSNRWLLPLGCWSALLLLVLTTSALASGRPVGVAAAPVVRGAQQPRAQATPLPTGANLDVLLLLDNSANMTAADPSGARGQVAQYIARYMAAATLATADSHRLGVISFGGASADPQLIQNLTRAASIDPNANWLTGSPQTPGDFNAALTLARQQAETARREDAGRQPVVFLFTSGYTGADSVTYFNATRAEVETYQQENIPLFVVSTKTAAAVPPWAALAAATSSVGISVSGLQLDLTPSSLTLVKTSVRNVLSALVPAVQLISAPAPAELKIAITEPLLDSLSIVIIKNAITDTAELQSDGVMVPPTDRTRDNQALIYSIANPDASIYNFQGTQGSVIGVVKRLPALDLVFGASQVEADTNLKVGLNIKTTRATSAVPIVATLVITNATKGVESQPLLLQPGPTSGVYSTTVLLHEGTYTVQATTGITTSSGSVVAVSRPSSVIRVVASRKPALGQFTVSGGPGITQTYQVLVPVINADTVLGQPVGAFLDQSIVFDPAQNAYPLRFSAPAGSIGTIITYTAQFTPTQLGTYSLIIRLRGITNAGLDFPVDGRFDKEIVAAPIPNPLAEALQWVVPLSISLLSLVGTIFLWRNRISLPQVVALRRQAKKEVNRIMEEEKAKREADANAATAQMQLMLDREEANRVAAEAAATAQMQLMLDREEANRVAAEAAAEVRTQEQVDAAVQPMRDELNEERRKWEEEKANRVAAEAAAEVRTQEQVDATVQPIRTELGKTKATLEEEIRKREAADTKVAELGAPFKDLEAELTAVTQEAVEGKITPAQATSRIAAAQKDFDRKNRDKADPYYLDMLPDFFNGFPTIFPDSLLQRAIALSDPAIMVSNEYTEQFDNQFYEKVLKAAIPKLTLEHIIPFIYQWIDYYQRYIKENQQERENDFITVPIFEKFVDRLIKLMRADSSPTEALKPGSEDDIKQKLGDLLKRYVAILPMIVENMADTHTLEASNDALQIIADRFFALTKYRSTLHPNIPEHLGLYNQLDDIQLRIVTPLLRLAHPSAMDRYSAILPIHTTDLERLDDPGHLIPATASYFKDPQGSLGETAIIAGNAARATPPDPPEESAAPEEQRIVAPAADPNQDQIAVMDNVRASLAVVKNTFALLYKTMHELTQRHHEPWQEANALIYQELEDLEEAVGRPLVLAEPRLFSLALRHLQGYVDKYKQENAARYEVKLVARVQPLVVVAGNRDGQGSLDDNVYHVTLRNDGSIEAIVRDIQLDFSYGREVVFELHHVDADSSIKDRRIRPGEERQFVIRAGKNAELLSSVARKSNGAPGVVAEFDVRFSCTYENIFMPAQKQAEMIALQGGSVTARYYHRGSKQQPYLSGYGDSLTPADASPIMTDQELQSCFEDYFYYNVEFAERLRKTCANQRKLVAAVSDSLKSYLQARKDPAYLAGRDYDAFEIQLASQNLALSLWDPNTPEGSRTEAIYSFISNFDKATLWEDTVFDVFCKPPHQYSEEQVAAALEQLYSTYRLIESRGLSIQSRSSLMQQVMRNRSKQGTEANR